MKKTYFSLMLSASVLLWACNNAGEGSSNATTDSGSSSSTMNNGSDTGTMSSMSTGDSSTSMSTPTSTSSAPLSASDKKFVMEAANGGMMEVESGKIAQDNAQSDRIKNYASMMVQDHSKANDELKSLVSSKGITIPEDSLMNKNKSHLDAMRKMKGAEFDSHYKSMMLSDHKKDVSDFEKASKSLTDPDLKAWATKTLPVLKTHLDSIQAINKAKM